MTTASREPIAINGRTYAWPPRPLVVVCVDGCEPDYIEQAFRAYADDVRAGRFPGPEQCYQLDPTDEAEIREARKINSGKR